VVLQLGETSDSVQVSGAIALVETIGGGLRETVDEKRISELPLNGRNPLDLQLLVPRSVPSVAADTNLGGNNDLQLNTPAIVPNPTRVRNSERFHWSQSQAGLELWAFRFDAVCKGVETASRRTGDANTIHHGGRFGFALSW
jgi:hypothetical protein